ncbi:MAG: response regulator [Treponema sp.]|jgi:signal transduction histidine kinase/CheY-like chemotaxis protein/HPt (histidine-containing phosphotransfer) domain-containing protein|nr:response regulator [Treponema sp.]
MTQPLIQLIAGISILISAVATIVIVNNWGQPRMKWLAFLSALVTASTMGYFFRVCAASAESVVIAFQMQQLTAPYLGVAAALFGLDYTGRPLRNRIVIGSLFVIPVLVTFFAVCMDLFPGYFLSAPELVRNGETLLFKFHAGPFYYTYLIYNFGIYFISGIFVIRYFILLKRGPGHNTVFIIILILPAASKLIWFLHLPFVQFELFYPVRAVSLVLFYWYTMRYQEVEWRNLGWEAIVGKLTDAVVVFDSRRRIINVNSSFRAFFPSFSFTEKSSTMENFVEYLRERILEVFPEDLFEEFGSDELLPGSKGGHCFSQGEFTINQEKIPGRAGSAVSSVDKRSFTVTFQAVKENGRIIGYTLILNDVSVYRNMIDQIVELKERAEAASRSKSDFLATMSHEIRTPLNAIIGFSEILLRKDLSGEVYTDLEKIHSSGSVLLEIISDILDISKIESGNLTLFPVTYTISSLINDTIHLNLVRVGSKPINFRLDIDDTIPGSFTGDELRVKQILNNLLSNAIKYTSEGTVTLDIGWEKQGENTATLIFKISDTGQGIKQEDMGKLFTRYIQLNSVVNRSIEGTGLGLSITKTLVELMNGAITVESEYNKGSTFTAVIRQEIADAGPLGKEIADKLRKFKFLDSRRRNKRDVFRTKIPGGRVLVVDDMQTNIDVARGLMLPYGITTDGAAGGPGAVELVRSEKQRYDLIFMDHMMPGMDGIEAACAIRALGTDYAKTVPIVALTANAVAGNMDIFLKNGINDFLAKPVDIQRLNEILEKWIPGEKQIKTARDLEEQEARDRFPPIPGVDIEAGILNTGGTLDGYRRILGIFLQDTGTRLPQIQAALEKGDYEEYALLVHAVKGAFRIIGAAAVAETAARIEESARAWDVDAVAAEHGAFVEQLALMMEKIREALSP